MKILLIEDDTDDVELMHIALQMNKVDYMMDVVHDGMAALQYMHSNKARPSIIIMDFNIPKLHGRELLTEIKSSNEFKDIPLVILSTSSAAGDIEFSYRNGAARYIVKPTTTAEFNETINTIVRLATAGAAAF